MKLGSLEVSPITAREELLTALVWGKAGTGKTVLASTMPGKKLWLQFDPNGTASLKRRDDVFVADFSAYKAAKLADFKQGGVIESDLLKLIKEGGFNSVVADSLTHFGQLALHYGIVSGKASVGRFVASIEAPGQTGYGVRSALMLDFCTMLLRVCADSRAHCMFTAHEQETVNEDGSVTEITMNLGGQGKNIIPAKISEIWHMEDTGKERKLYVRAHGVKRPMRTRMFTVPEGQTSFVFKYNQETGNGQGIEDWYAAWKAAGFDKIRVPV